MNGASQCGRHVGEEEKAEMCRGVWHVLLTSFNTSVLMSIFESGGGGEI
jgi:hypothetical protein